MAPTDYIQSQLHLLTSKRANSAQAEPLSVSFLSTARIMQVLLFAHAGSAELPLPLEKTTTRENSTYCKVRSCKHADSECTTSHMSTSQLLTHVNISGLLSPYLFCFPSSVIVTGASAYHVSCPVHPLQITTRVAENATIENKIVKRTLWPIALRSHPRCFPLCQQGGECISKRVQRLGQAGLGMPRKTSPWMLKT